MRNMRKFGRSRALLARNFAFTPFKPQRMVGPLPSSVTATPEVKQQLERQGVESMATRPFERQGTDYPYPEPQIFQARVSLDDNINALNAGAKVTLGGFRLAKNTAADAVRFIVDTNAEATFQALRFALEINGKGFIQQQFFTLPFPEGVPQNFFREVISQASVNVIVQIRPGAVLIPPLGTADLQVFVNAYQGKFL